MILKVCPNFVSRKIWLSFRLIENDLLMADANLFDPQEIVYQYFRIKSEVKKQPGELDLNYFVKAEDGFEFILKISHAGEDRRHLDLQNQAMIHLQNHPTGLNIPAVIPDHSGKNITTLTDENGASRMVRLLSWVSGKVWAKANPHTPEMLADLGRASGALAKALQTFEHPAAHRNYKWDLDKVLWIEAYRDIFPDPEQRQIISYFLDLYHEKVVPVKDRLRCSVNYNDANDYNILVSEGWPYKVVSLIDFGDIVYTQTINEVAIALAYALMGKPDPLAAAVELIRGFHQEMPLNEEEVAVLFPLIAARLMITVTNAAMSRMENPENDYLQISEEPAWELLNKLRRISPNLAHYTFRYACGFEVVDCGKEFLSWAKSQDFAPIVGVQLSEDSVVMLDLSVGSTSLGNNQVFNDPVLFDRKIQRMMEDAGKQMGIGRYNEVRPFYTTDGYLVRGNEGPEWRTVHLGADIFMGPGTGIYAPWEGKIHSFANNDAERDFGPTLILHHQPENGPEFFTLYGHLSVDSMTDWETGQKIEKGEKIGEIGPMPENGNWPPHLHFQVIMDMLDHNGDFPGVAFPRFREIWKGISPDPGVMLGLEVAAKEDHGPESLLPQRKKILGKSLSLSYEQPLKMVRGFGQYLYDHSGRRYLDTVNNVPHVGHQHPRVVEAAQRQISVLNTNTRYLHDNIVNFAEDLLATLPDQLEVVHFVNSGSEANELALRMAKAASGNRDMIVLEVGYHGNTNACIDISSYKFDGKGGKGAPDWVHVSPMPDIYRGLYRGRDAGARYAGHIDMIIDELKAKAKSPSGFIHESILSCGGQIVLPDGFLQKAYASVRAAGGVCIADEVQVGFGRVGETFWGFELQGVVPDIVTMGKPIGNGHPLGAVVCTRKVAEAFANGMEYFNTFGGNPVSCAIGHEVLKIIKEEGLQEHARQMGDFLLKGLKELQQTYPVIGDVRGHGLFLGFELVQDREKLTPAPEQATYLANRMRRMGILMSTDGPFHNVIKIKPPMVFNRDNGRFLLETLEQILREDPMKTVS